MQSKKLSQGFALFEVLIAGVVTTAIAVWGVNAWVNQAQESAAEATSAWLWGVKQAMDNAVLDARNKVHLKQGKIDLGDVKLPQTLLALKNTGHLARDYPLNPPLPYSFSMRVVQESATCSDDQCVLNAIMALEPTADLGSTYPLWSQASVMLMALKGQGLAVWQRSSNRLVGAQYQGLNPPDSGVAYKVGSVAVISRVMMRAPPFVRLNESRPVSLSGPVKLAGAVHLKQGLVIEALQTTDAACQIPGQVVRRAKGGLLACENGHWRAVGDGLFTKIKPLSYHTCRGSKPISSFLLYVMSNTPFDFRSPIPPPPGDCHCNAGYRPVLAHSARIDPHGVGIKNGFVCASP
jgi:Tfp pilus assembly protein PilE